jgi:hypothetical protein
MFPFQCFNRLLLLIGMEVLLQSGLPWLMSSIVLKLLSAKLKLYMREVRIMSNSTFPVIQNNIFNFNFITWKSLLAFNFNCKVLLKQSGSK